MYSVLFLVAVCLLLSFINASHFHHQPLAVIFAPARRRRFVGKFTAPTLSNLSCPWLFSELSKRMAFEARYHMYMTPTTYALRAQQPDMVNFGFSA